MSKQLANNSIFLTLFAHSGAGSYHWGIHAKTSDEPAGVLFHATNPTGAWQFSVKNPYSFETSQSAILSLKIGSLGSNISAQYLQGVLANVALGVSPAFTCRIWVKNAVQTLSTLGIIDCPNVDELEAEAKAEGEKHREAIERGKGSWGYAVSTKAK